MFISQIHIKHYRCFSNTQIDFHPGVNVIIGENNAGKTALLKALALIFDRKRRKSITVYDFHRGITDFSTPPTIEVTVTLESSEGDTQDDKALVAPWITKIASPWQATLSYEYALPEEHHGEFDALISKQPATISQSDHFWKTVARLLPKYVARIYGGDSRSRNRAEPEALARFDFQFLDAIRDAESELYSGSHPLLKSMLTQILDDPSYLSEAEIETYRGDFERRTQSIFEDNIEKRLNIDKLFELINKTGAQDGGSPKLHGSITESELISALQLLIDRVQYRLPIDHNGLGYNNLLYISLVLASLNYESSVANRGQNAVVFPMLVIEEPEAHLHPALQYKLLKHIKEQQTSPSEGSRQVFITTHSTHITAASGLDPIICMSIDETSNGIHVAYPGRVFGDHPESVKSKRYVERYLDATKSTMLFSKEIILVEGIAEQLLLPQFADYLAASFEDSHVCVVPVGGINFKHFLPLFGIRSARPELGLHKRVSCITDADPSRKEKNVLRARYKSCFPYEVGLHSAQFDYRQHSDALQNLLTDCHGATFVHLFHSEKTFEYDLALVNTGQPILITEVCSHRDAILDYIHNPALLPKEVQESLQEACLDDAIAAITDVTQQSNATFATVYLLAVENAKGEHAFLLANALKEERGSLQAAFKIPHYLERAIQWVCHGTT